MAEANGEVALRDPDDLVKDIERTRENLARTIDTLTERVSPANVASAPCRGYGTRRPVPRFRSARQRS